MKHDPRLADDLIIKSLEAKLAKMEARLARLEAMPPRAPVRTRVVARSASPSDAAKAAPILDRAARLHGCTVAEICGPRGSKRAILARSEAAYECQRAGLSSTITGLVLGGRDHSTALYLSGRHKARMGIEREDNE